MNSADADTAPPGEALRAAREARNLSLRQAAEELRLVPEQVMAMEEGRYDSLGPAVFARGHLRRYAMLLGLPATAVLESYEATHAHETPPDLVPPASLHTPVAEPRSPPAAIMTVLVPAALAAVVAGAWWLQGRESSGPGEAPAGSAIQAPPATEDEGLTALQDAAPPAPAGAAAPRMAASDRLSLGFTDACWVEVYDATGQRLAYELAGPGAALAFSGPAPWRVVLGNVRGARLALDGRDLALPGSAVVQNTASIYVDEAGTVARVPASQQDDT